MQSIQTKYIGPTNFRGSRIKATSTNGTSATIPYSYDDRKDSDLHKHAVMALLVKLGDGWGSVSDWHPGSTKEGYSWVNVKSSM